MLQSKRHDLISGASRAARQLSPRRHRWLRFLRSLPLDADALTKPLASPEARDFIICGCSRTGTTLLAAALYQPPSVVTVVEPWDGMRLEPATLFKSLREEVSTGTLSRGKLDIEALTNQGSVARIKEGSSPQPVIVEPDFSLGVKWPAYWRFLDLLPETKFLICVRHPTEVINSFKKSGGRLAEGLNYDTRFNQQMNDWLQSATTDVALRRVLLFEYVHKRIAPHLDRSNAFVVRYERWFTDRTRLMDEIGDFLGQSIGSGAPVIRPPKSGGSLPAEELALLRQHCESAHLLGYELEDSAA